MGGENKTRYGGRGECEIRPLMETHNPPAGIASGPTSLPPRLSVFRRGESQSKAGRRYRQGRWTRDKLDRSNGQTNVGECVWQTSMLRDLDTPE